VRRIFSIFWAVCVYAQSGIEVPGIGAVIDASGSLRPVQGVAGNFWLGPATASGVVSAACSERLCLAKTDSKILSATGETDAPPGPAIFGLVGDQAIVFFSEPRIFARWHEDTLDSLDWKTEGEVLSIRGTEIAVRRDGNVWIVHPDGALVDWVADTAGPVLLLSEGVLFATPDELVLRHGNGEEVRFALPGAESIAQMNPHYSSIRSGNAVYALRMDTGRESLFQLPGTIP
jgi:hypothetical protein